MPAMTLAEARIALEGAVAELPTGLRDHVLRVVVEARRLAVCYGVDELQATVAALGHDLARAKKPAELLDLAKSAGIELSDVERAAPILIHGAIAAAMMADRYGVADAGVLAAARYHTTGRAGMSVLERLIFVADKIEPGKARAAPTLEEAGSLAEESLEAAMRRLLDDHLSRALERGWPLHPDAVAARNELLRSET